MSYPKSFKVVAGLAAVMIAVQFINAMTHYGLNGYGILPRTAGGLIGIVVSPFLHASFSHLIGNLMAFLVLGWLVAAEDHARFVNVSTIIVLLGGLLVWAFGRSSYHIGASGWIFGLWAYLIARAWFTRSFINLLIALAVLLVYGSMALGFLPRLGVSVESHIFGAVAGVVAALLTRPLNKRVSADGGAI